MSPCNTLRRLGGMAQDVADRQFRYFQFVQYSGQPTAECMKTMPFNASRFRFGNYNIPNQMAEVNGPLRVRRRVKDVSRSSISCKMRVEIFLHNTDYWHRSLTARCLRIHYQF